MRELKDTAGSGEDSSDAERGDAHNENHGPEEQLELFLAQLGAHVVNKGMDLAQAKHTQSLQGRIT